MTTNTLPIVGAFYRPPAKALIDALPIGTRLQLIAEPDNAFDPNAIAVWLEVKDIPESVHSTLEESLPAFGHSLDTLKAQDAWHLGYLRKEKAKELKDNGFPSAVPVEGSFRTSASGSPMVSFDYE